MHKDSMCTPPLLPHLCAHALMLLQTYEEQHQQASSRLSDLDRQFKSAVASILGITPDGQPQQLAAALQEQQQLQEVQVCACGCCLRGRTRPSS